MSYRLFLVPGQQGRGGSGRGRHAAKSGSRESCRPGGLTTWPSRSALSPPRRPPATALRCRRAAFQRRSASLRARTIAGLPSGADAGPRKGDSPPAILRLALDKAAILSSVLDGYRPEDVGSALGAEGIAVPAHTTDRSVKDLEMNERDVALRPPPGPTLGRPVRPADACPSAARSPARRAGLPRIPQAGPRGESSTTPPASGLCPTWSRASTSRGAGNDGAGNGVRVRPQRVGADAGGLAPAAARRAWWPRTDRSGRRPGRRPEAAGTVQGPDRQDPRAGNRHPGRPGRAVRLPLAPRGGKGTQLQALMTSLRAGQGLHLYIRN